MTGLSTAEDGPQLHRRAADWPISTRVVVLEVEVAGLKDLAKTQNTLIDKLDKRADRNDVMMARLLAGLAVLMFLGQLFVPVISRFLNLPTN